MDAICSVCDYILNIECDIDAEHMGQIKKKCKKLGTTKKSLDR